MKKTHHLLRFLGLAAIMALFAGCASAPQALSPAAQKQLAPTGKLRVAFPAGNRVLVEKDGASGEWRGVVIDISRRLAEQIGVAVEPVPGNVAQIVENLKAGKADIGFMAYDPKRAAELDFTAPYMEVANTYLVPAGSPIRSISDVDRPGVRVVVQAKNAADLYLSRTLKHAQLVRVTGGAASAAELLNGGKAEAWADNHQTFAEAMALLPAARALDGRFSAIPHAVALPKGREAALQFMRQAIEREKSSGAVKTAIDRAGIRGVNVAPPAGN